MNLEDDLLIEQFLRNELSENEKNNFLKRIANDTNFKEQFVFEKQLFESLNEKEWSFAENTTSAQVAEYKKLFEDKETQKLKKVIQKTNADYKNRKKGRVITLVSSIAAVALLFITLNVFLNTTINTNELYSENISLKELPSFTTRGNEDSSDLIKAEKLFKEKNYKESVVLFDKVLLSEKENSGVYIYKAIAHAALNQFEEAEAILEQLIQSDLIDAEKGYWYKSLVYLKSNQLDKVKTTLSKIIANSLYKKKEAVELLEKL